MYLPAEDGSLKNRSNLVYNDSVWLASRIDRDHDSFSFVHAGLDLNLCEKLRISPLSESVVEKLLAGRQVKDPETSDILERILAHPQIPDAFVRIARHQVFRGSSITGWSKIPTPQSIHEQLASFRIVLAQHLQTSLVFKRKLDVTKAGHKSVECFVDKRSKKIYLQLPFKPQVLAYGLGRLLPILNDSIPSLTCVLNAALSGEDLERTLDIQQVNRVDRTQEALLRGVCGAEVAEDDTEFLQRKPLRDFSSGEIIAYQSKQGKMRYGQVKSSVRDAFGVLTKVEIKLDTSGRTSKLSSKDVFSFRSNLVGDRSKQKSDAAPEMKRKVSMESPRLPMDFEFEENPENEPDGAKAESSSEAEDIMSLINATLRKLNIDLNPEKMEAIKENLDLRQKVKDLEEQNAELEQKSKNLDSNLDNIATAMTCSICQEEPVDMAFQPCGHLACNTCSVRLIKCHLCRKVINARHKFVNPIKDELESLDDSI